MGKTLAFALPLIERVLAARATAAAGAARGGAYNYGRAPLALVMTPTRELAQQVCGEVESVAGSLACYCVYGGTPMGPSCNAIRAGLDVIIGTRKGVYADRPWGPT